MTTACGSTPEPRWTVPALSSLTRQLSTATVHRAESGLLLLADLHRLHRRAAGVSLDWELLAQAAQAMRQQPLLVLAHACHPQTVRQMKWANAHLKASSPQIIAS